MNSVGGIAMISHPGNAEAKTSDAPAMVWGQTKAPWLFQQDSQPACFWTLRIDKRVKKNTCK